MHTSSNSLSDLSESFSSDSSYLFLVLIVLKSIINSGFRHAVFILKNAMILKSFILLQTTYMRRSLKEYCECDKQYNEQCPRRTSGKQVLEILGAMSKILLRS